jgi:hypothetical protein
MRHILVVSRRVSPFGFEGLRSWATFEFKRPNPHLPMATDHYSVYVVYLRNPKGDGRAGYYVGMTGLTPEERFKNHKQGIKAARVVKRYGVRLVPKLFAHLNPMPYAKAVEMEAILADSLRKRGYAVYGGH